MLVACRSSGYGLELLLSAPLCWRTQCTEAMQVYSWLQADLQPPKFEVWFAPKSRHSNPSFRFFVSCIPRR